MRADVDGDGSVSIIDISMVGVYFIQGVPPAPARYDQGTPPRDNAISIIDISNMGLYFLQPVTNCP
jgi:hypothetical protein